MALFPFFPDQVFLASNAISHQEESRLGLMLGQDLQYAGRARRGRAIIESQRHARAWWHAQLRLRGQVKGETHRERQNPLSQVRA
jgi:hypothetical protein